MKTNKYAYEVEVRNGRIDVLDDNGTVLKSLDLADVIFKAVEAGCGLTIKK